MAGAFMQGVATAEAQNEKNPFNIILGKFQESQARRYREDSERKKEEAELSKALQVLSYQKNYETELQKAKAEEERAQIGLRGEEDRKTKELELSKTSNLPTLENLQKLMGGSMPPGSKASVKTAEGVTVDLPLNREYTEGESKSLGMSGALIDQINEMKDVVKSDMELHKQGKTKETAQVLGAFPLALGSKKGQDYQRLRKSILTTITYLRSGAQINDQEFSRFSSLLPTARINDETDIKQLDRFINEFSQVQGRIRTGAKWDKNKKEFVGRQQQAQGKKQGGQIMVDASGNKAMVYPDGTFDEVQ